MIKAKYTNEANGGKLTPATEREPDYSTGSDEQNPMKVDPSVRLGELRGEPLGCVPMATTVAKPQAYKATKGPE